MYKELVDRLREHAEWAAAAIERLQAEIARIKRKKEGDE